MLVWGEKMYGKSESAGEKKKEFVQCAYTHCISSQLTNSKSVNFRS